MNQHNQYNPLESDCLLASMYKDLGKRSCRTDAHQKFSVFSLTTLSVCITSKGFSYAITFFPHYFELMYKINIKYQTANK